MPHKYNSANGSKFRIDRNEIERTLRLLTNPHDVVEVRCLGRIGCRSGYFDDPHNLSETVVTFSEQTPPTGTYFTINPCLPDCIYRGKNRIGKLPTMTADKEIARRQTLLFDFDPARLPNISSTDDEHQAAIETARYIKGELEQRNGFPAGILADSGNGAHLLYKVDLDNDADATRLIKAVLHAVKYMHFPDGARAVGGVQIKIDQSVFNASRISKLYGTWVRKGEDTQERPHRRSKLLDVPESFDVVPKTTLQALADCGSCETTTTYHTSSVVDPDALDRMRKWIDKWLGSSAVRCEKEKGDYTAIELVNCPYDESHTGGSAYITVAASGAVAFNCHHDSCQCHSGDGSFRRLREHVKDYGLDNLGLYDAEVAGLWTAEQWPQTPPNATQSTIDGTTTNEPKPDETAAKVAIADDVRNDPMFAYLWLGAHGRHLTDKQRQNRIDSTNDVLRFIPHNSLFSAYLRYVMPTTDAPVWFHIATSMSMAAHVINRRAYIVSGTDRYYPVMWLAVLAKSGGRKSSSLGPVKNLMLNDPDLRETIIGDKFTFASLTQRLGIPFDGKDQPTLNEVLDQCRTLELTNKNFASGVGYCQVSEIASLLAAMNKSHSEESKPSFADWFDCPPFDKKETATQGKYLIYRPFLSILGASTIEWLVNGCRAGDLEGGFLPRWLFFANGRQDFNLSFRDSPDDEAEAELYRHVQRLKQFAGRMTFADDAETAYHNWYQSFVTDTDSVVKSFNSRLAIYTQKIAMIFEATTSGASIISASSVTLACGLVDRLKSDLLDLLDNQISFNETDRLCNKFVEMIREAGGRMEHRRALKNMHVSAKQFKAEIVPTCLERGDVTIAEIRTATKPNIVYQLTR